MRLLEYFTIGQVGLMVIFCLARANDIYPVYLLSERQFTQIFFILWIAFSITGLAGLLVLGHEYLKVNKAYRALLDQIKKSPPNP